MNLRWHLKCKLLILKILTWPKSFKRIRQVEKKTFQNFIQFSVGRWNFIMHISTHSYKGILLQLHENHAINL